MEEEDVRREAAIASSPSLQPNFNSPGVTKDQLSKFQTGKSFHDIVCAFLAEVPNLPERDVDKHAFIFRLCYPILERELHKKRMQIKKKSEQKRWKDETRKFQKRPNSKNRIDEDTSVEDSSLSNSSLNSKEDSSVEQQDMQQQITLMKRQKLHWGLDVKERWERKSNM